MALADHVEKNKLEGQLRYSLFVGASSGAEVENRWAKLDMIERRTPHQVGKEIAKGINNGKIKFFDKHLSMFPVDLLYVSCPVSFYLVACSQVFFIYIGILHHGPSQEPPRCCCN